MSDSPSARICMRRTKDSCAASGVGAKSSIHSHHTGWGLVREVKYALRSAAKTLGPHPEERSEGPRLEGWRQTPVPVAILRDALASLGLLRMRVRVCLPPQDE